MISMAPPDAATSMTRHREVVDELAVVAGALNAGWGRMLELTMVVVDEQHHVGPGLTSPAQFLEWRTGYAKSTCQSLVRLAKRRDELPCVVASLIAGEISLDQAGVVARWVPREYEAAAARFAKEATVAQLKAVLPRFGFEKRARPADRHVSTGRDEQGWFIRGRLDEDEGALVDRALEAMREDLWHQRKADAASAAAESGGPEATVPSASLADGLVAAAEATLQAGEAAHPGSERFLVSLHLQAAPDGSWQLLDEHGLPFRHALRRQLLCDLQGACVHHDRGGVPLSVGRRTRHVSRKLRRAILHRHRGRCAVPGCDARRGLEIHHILHWEDGGHTDTDNLLPLCRHHHRLHHEGLLHIEGDADRSAGAVGAVVFFDRYGHPMDPCGTPVVTHPDPTGHARCTEPGEGARDLMEAAGIVPGRASTPRGERLDRRGFHLAPDPPPGRWCT